MSTSSQTPKPWPPYSTTDCSLGICSVYCPQWCYLLFPPPPPPRHHQPTFFSVSPIVIGVIGVLLTAFILVCYFIFISKYCRRRGGGDGRITTEFNDGEQWREQQSPGGSSTVGLDGTVINEIPVCKYKRPSSGDEGLLIQGTECSVCLGEFQEDESLRLLPKCCHAFHVNCIDAWFKSHSTCPICRANVAVIPMNDVVVTSV